MPNWLDKFYQLIFTRQIYLLILVFFAGLSIFAFQIKHFRLDASSDSLVLENDQSVLDYRDIKAKFGSDDFLFVTFSPNDKLFSAKNIKILTNLESQFEQIDGIDSVTSILNVPLFNVEGVTLTNFGDKAYYVTPDGDLEKAKEGFISNPLYRNLLVNEEASTTAMVLYIKPRTEFLNVTKAIEAIHASGNASSDNKQLRKLELEKKRLIKEADQLNRKIITLVRAILKSFKKDNEIYIGGVPMIASDMIDYVQSDLVVFGFMVLAFIISVLTLIFRQFAWIIIPLICCFCSIVVTMSYLGLMRWPVTVISSNFVSLLLIMTMSITIHLVVRFQELTAKQPDSDVRSLLLSTLNSMFLPCIYTSLTTIVAFGSLIVSDIRPVIDFGKMMIIGVSFSFIISFFLLPALSYFCIKQAKLPKKQLSFQKLTEVLAKFTDKNRAVIGFTSVAVAVFSLTGLLNLSVDNRFIDYFKSSTEIHQGMKVIDQKLGGTTPLDIVLKKEAVKIETFDSSDEDDEFADDEFADDEFADDEFADDEAGSEDDGIFEPSVWFTPEGRDLLREVHTYVDSLNETGKVLSLWTTNELIQLLNEQQPLNDFELSVLQKNFPDDLKSQLLTPYFHAESEDAHIAVRVIESQKDLKRSDLIEKIQAHFEDKLNIAPEHYQLSGMLILYNNMLSSLFNSQIKTLGTVFLAIVIMFSFLFRSVVVALIAILPNLLSALFILGSMGWFGIPLDMMTITIAAITIGIAVDNTIHYIYRFKRDFSERKHYMQSMYYCHSSIGKAMYYTSMTIIFGFSILALSNFIPTIYFGLFTSLAMFIALLANLTMLPLLIIKIKPFGSESLEPR